MICKKCGNEFEGNFCPQCGEKAGDSVNEMNQNANIEKKNNKNVMPFCFKMWFIILIALFTGFIACLPAIVLFVIRLVKYPEHRRSAWLSLGGLIVAFIVLGALIAIMADGGSKSANTNTTSSVADEKKVEDVNSNTDNKIDSNNEKEGNSDNVKETSKSEQSQPEDNSDNSDSSDEYDDEYEDEPETEYDKWLNADTHIWHDYETGLKQIEILTDKGFKSFRKDDKNIGKTITFYTHFVTAEYEQRQRKEVSAGFKSLTDCILTNVSDKDYEILDSHGGWIITAKFLGDNRFELISYKDGIDYCEIVPEDDY